MIDIWNDLDDMFGLMNAIVNRNKPKNSLADNGLKTVIQRPHNLLTLKNKDGAVIGHRLEVVTTPFKKDEVTLSVLNNILTVKCGPVIKCTDKSNDSSESELIGSVCSVYHGISSQSFEFSLKLADNIDQQRITASVNEGVLKIDFPIKEIEDKKEQPLQIEVK